MRSWIPGLLLTAGLAACGGAEAPPPPPPVPVFGAQSGYARVSDEIVDWYLSRHPDLAVLVGDHTYDSIVGSYFPVDLERAGHDARSLLTRLQSVNRSTLPRDDYFDHRLLEYGVRAELLDLEEIGGWQRDPTRYVALGFPPAVGGGGPDATEMSARWRQLPLVFRAARQNLVAERVTPAHVDATMGAAAELRDILTNPPVSLGGAATRAARERATAALDSFVVWLDDLGARASGGGLGAENLARLLLYSSHVDVPLDVMDQLNRQAIADHREWMERVALEIDPLSHAEDIIAAATEQDRGITDVVGPVLAPANDQTSWPRALFSPDRVSLDVSHYAGLADVESETVGNVDRLMAIRRALLGHALLHGMLQLHANGLSLEDAARDIAAIGMIGEEEAILWANSMLADPEFGLLALDRMQIFALRERLRARGGGFSEQAFRDQLLDLGLPIPLAAEALLGDELTPLLVVGRRTPGVPEPPVISN